MTVKYKRFTQRLLGSITAVAMCGLLVPAFAQGADSQAELLNKALKRIEKLERSLDEMKRAQPPNAKETQYLKEDVAEVMERLQETEKKTLMDKINLGVEMRTRIDNMHWEDTTGMNDIEDNTDNFWSSRFRLRMNAKLSEHLQFHGRASVYKNWSDYDYSGNYWETNISERPTDTTLRLDRAYVDLIFSDWALPTAFTVGRQPTTAGPPEHLKDNTAIRSTYPSLLFQREMDAVNVTFGLSKWTGLENSAFRVMYGKFLQVDNDDAFYIDADLGDDVPMLWVQAETKLAGIFSDTTAIVTYIRNWDMPGAPSEAVTSQSGDLGYNENLGFTVISDNFANIGLDWFISFGLSESNSSGDTVMMDLNPMAPGPEQYGLLSTGPLTDDHSGSAIYVGVRYKLPFEVLNGAKVGVEYNHGSKYWWANNSGTDDPFAKLATRGDAWEVYYLQPIVDHAHMRLGVLDIDYDYFSRRAAPVGKPVDVEQDLRVWSLMLDVNF